MLAGEGLQPSSKVHASDFQETSALESTALLPKPKSLLPAIGWRRTKGPFHPGPELDLVCDLPRKFGFLSV